MAILIGTTVLLSLVWQIYRSGRRLLSRSPEPNPILARIFPDVAGPGGGEVDRAAEAREADLLT